MGYWFLDPWKERKELIDEILETARGRNGNWCGTLLGFSPLFREVVGFGSQGRSQFQFPGVRAIYSETGGDGGSSGLGEMPNLTMASRYVREFPNGPFVEEIYTLLGNFYSDLFLLIKELEKHQGGYKYGCSAKY